MDNPNLQNQAVAQWLAQLNPPADWTPAKPQAWQRLQASQTAFHRRRRNRIAAIGVIGVASATALAFPSTQVLAQRCWDACVAESTRVSSFVLRTLTPADPASRPLAPDFLLQDATGAPVQLSSLKGKVVLLNFWATWCPPCLDEIPWFVDFQRTHRDRGFTAVGISLDEGGWADIKPFLNKHPVNYPILAGNDEITRLYGGVESLPTTFLIDREGRIAFTHVGLVSRQTYAKQIATLLAE